MVRWSFSVKSFMVDGFTPKNLFTPYPVWICHHSCVCLDRLHVSLLKELLFLADGVLSSDGSDENFSSSFEK